MAAVAVAVAAGSLDGADEGSAQASSDVSAAWSRP